MGGVLADHHGLPGQDEKGLGACAETHLLSHGTKPGPKVRALFVSAQSQFNVAFWPVAPDIAPQCNVGIWGYCGRAVSINDLAQSNGTSRRNQVGLRINAASDYFCQDAQFCGFEPVFMFQNVKVVPTEGERQIGLTKCKHENISRFGGLLFFGGFEVLHRSASTHYGTTPFCANPLCS
jgi:hypothetical protein